MEIKNKAIAKIFIFGILLFGIAFVLGLQFVMAADPASFQVTSFSCTPSEVPINDVFSCTAQVQNTGGTAGYVTIATLYPDTGNWLEESNYPQASGVSVEAGQSTEITFNSLRATKSGNNGFSKIMLDDSEDMYVVDNNIEVNVIDVVVTVSNSVSSAEMGDTFNVEAGVTAGGDIDISLTFTEDSGGCSIGSQTNPKEITGLSDGQTQSVQWIVTQGTSGACRYTVSAAATGRTGGVASKTDESSSSVSCTDCSGGSAADTSGGGGGGGAGAATGAKTYTLETLASSQEVELATGEKATFSIESKEYTLTLKNFTETTAEISIGSKTFKLKVEEKIEVDLDGDGTAEISIKLKSVNLITNKVKLILSPLVAVEAGAPGEGGKGTTGETIKDLFKNPRSKLILIIIIVFVVVAIISAYYLIKRRNR